MAGERRSRGERDYRRSNYRSSQLARKEPAATTSATAIQSELSSKQSASLSGAEINPKRAMTKSTRSKYANAAHETATSPSCSRCKPRLDMFSSLVFRQPSPTTNNVKSAMDQVSKPLETNCYSEDLDSLSPPSTHVKTTTYSSFRPSPSRSSSYSPPPSKPKAPKLSLVAIGKSKKTFSSVLGKRSSVEKRDYSPGLTSTMMYAPWNDHQPGMEDPKTMGALDYEVELSDSDVDHSVKRARRNSHLPDSIEKCDNYGCNANHSHLDCPLGRKCWGCRANTHYTSACPMTCVKCGFAGHARKFCEDFEIDPREGIPRPRISAIKPASADMEIPALPLGKTYQCDNFPCHGLHSHYDCPLPTICWGCRATDHFWSGCQARCDKCGLQRHISKYCNEFESWMDGKSRPKKTQDEIRRVIAVKRQRETEMPLVEVSNPQPHGLNHSTASSMSLPPPTKRPASPSTREYGRLTPEGSHPEQHGNSFGAHHKQMMPSQAIPTQPRMIITRNNFPVLQHGPNGEKIYCTYWLRTGNCRFKNESIGCSLKHKVPAEKKLQDGIGIDFRSPWLQDDPIVQEYYKKIHYTHISSNGTSEEHGQHEVHHRPSLTGSHTRVREPPNSQDPIKKPTTTVSPIVQESSHQPAEHIQPAKQSARNDFNPLELPADITELLPEPKKSSLSKLKPPIEAKQPRRRTSESLHRHKTHTEENRSISPYHTAAQIEDYPQSKRFGPVDPLRSYSYGSRSAHNAGTENTSEPSYITTSQTTDLRKAAPPTAPRAIAETLARMPSTDSKKDVAKKENPPKETLPPKISSVNPSHIASPTAAVLAPAPTTESSRADKLSAFEEEEFFLQRKHEAEMARKEEELRLVYMHEMARKEEELRLLYEHEKRMAELRK